MAMFTCGRCMRGIGCEVDFVVGAPNLTAECAMVHPYRATGMVGCFAFHPRRNLNLRIDIRSWIEGTGGGGGGEGCRLLTVQLPCVMMCVM